MTNTNWKRAVGACTAAALVVGAGLVFAPVANAAPAADPTTGLLGGVVTGATGLVGGLLGSGTPSTTPTAPVTVGTGNGGLTVGVGSTTVGVTANNGLGVNVSTSNNSGVGVQLGGTTTGATGTVTVSNGTTVSVPTGGGTTTTTPTGSTSTSTDPGTTTTTPSGTTSTPVMLTALSANAQYTTVYPAKDGYRDTETFTLNGTASDGRQHAASGTAKLTFGSSTVLTWPITATNQAITWNGLKGGKIVPGRYILTATIGDSASNWVAGQVAVDVSAKKLATATSLLTTKAVSGTHTMAAKPRAGLSKGKVYLRIVSSTTGVKGKQYLKFTHAGKTLKVRILNGKHTSKRVTIPKSFTTYKISHTWKKGTVKIKSLKYKYTYKALK